MTNRPNTVFLQVSCYACSELIGYFRVLENDDVREVSQELQFIWCKECKEKEAKEIEAEKLR